MEKIQYIFGLTNFIFKNAHYNIQKTTQLNRVIELEWKLIAHTAILLNAYFQGFEKDFIIHQSFLAWFPG